METQSRNCLFDSCTSTCHSCGWYTVDGLSVPCWHRSLSNKETNKDSQERDLLQAPLPGLPREIREIWGSLLFQEYEDPLISIRLKYRGDIPCSLVIYVILGKMQSHSNAHSVWFLGRCLVFSNAKCHCIAQCKIYLQFRFQAGSNPSHQKLFKMLLPWPGYWHMLAWLEKTPPPTKQEVTHTEDAG